MGVKAVAERWTRAARSMNAEDRKYALRIVDMAKRHSSEAFYALDDPLEAACLSVLVEILKEQERMQELGQQSQERLQGQRQEPGQLHLQEERAQGQLQVQEQGPGQLHSQEERAQEQLQVQEQEQQLLQQEQSQGRYPLQAQGQERERLHSQEQPSQERYPLQDRLPLSLQEPQSEEQPDVDH